MNAPAEAFRCQSLAKEIAAELRAKVRSESSMLAGQRVLITKFDHDPSRAVGSARHKRCSWPIGARQEQWLRAYPQATATQAVGDADELVWLAPSAKMNASLPAADIQRELAADPVKNAAEYMSVWRDDISGFIPADALEAATDTGVIQRPPSFATLGSGSRAPHRGAD